MDIAIVVLSVFLVLSATGVLNRCVEELGMKRGAAVLVFACLLVLAMLPNIKIGYIYINIFMIAVAAASIISFISSPSKEFMSFVNMVLLALVIFFAEKVADTGEYSFPEIVYIEGAIIAIISALVSDGSLKAALNCAFCCFLIYFINLAEYVIAPHNAYLDINSAMAKALLSSAGSFLLAETVSAISRITKKTANT